MSHRIEINPRSPIAGEVRRAAEAAGLDVTTTPSPERLLESVDLENRADLLAAAGRIGEASCNMKQANKIRAAELGSGDPNELRERCAAALRSLAVEGEK